MAQKKRVRPLLVTAAVLAVTLLGGALYWFQPWRLWTDVVVDEALPAVVDAARPSTATSLSGPDTSFTRSGPKVRTSPAPTTVPPSTVLPTTVLPTTRPPAVLSATVPPVTVPPATVPPAAVRPTPASPPATASQARLLSDGELISHEHRTTGSVELIRLADGHRALLLRDLRTSDGPALHVWLADAPVLTGSQGWYVFDDGAHLDLGDLKGNIGNQIYPIGDDVDLARYSAVTIWCERFSVSFGAARLMPA